MTCSGLHTYSLHIYRIDFASLPQIRIFKNPFVLFWSTENPNHTVNTDTNQTLRFRLLLCCTAISVKHDLIILICLCFRTDKIPATQYSAYVEACQRQRQQNSGYFMSQMLCVVLLLLLLSIYCIHQRHKAYWYEVEMIHSVFLTVLCIPRAGGIVCRES